MKESNLLLLNNAIPAELLRISCDRMIDDVSKVYRRCIEDVSKLYTVKYRENSYQLAASLMESLQKRRLLLVVLHK